MQKRADRERPARLIFGEWRPARVVATTAGRRTFDICRAMDEKLDYFIRQRATLRRQMTLQQRSASPDAAKIADYQRRIQELEAMMDRLLNPTATQ